MMTSVFAYDGEYFWERRFNNIRYCTQIVNYTPKMNINEEQFVRLFGEDFAEQLKRTYVKEELKSLENKKRKLEDMIV